MNEIKATQATPGPWKVEQGVGTWTFHQPTLEIVADSELPDRGVILAVLVHNDDLANFRANAHLIAASPSMHEELMRLLPLMGGWREVIAEIDDLAKSEALGKAMWASLDQIDNARSRIRRLVES